MFRGVVFSLWAQSAIDSQELTAQMALVTETRGQGRFGVR